MLLHRNFDATCFALRNLAGSGIGREVHGARAWPVASREKSGISRARITFIAALVAAVAPLFFAQPSLAATGCNVTVGGSVTCSNNTTTTPTTNTDGGTALSLDRIQTWNNGTPITASVNAVTVNGYGLELLQTGATSGTINLINNAGGAIDSDAGSATPALALIGNSGNISYSGAGTIFGTDQVGIYATNTGTGQISIVTAGTISAGDNSGGDDYGIETSATNGATTIDLTGGTIEGASTGGLGDGAGIYARSVSGNIGDAIKPGITSNNIGADSSDRAYTGIDAAITGNGSGQLRITSLGTVYATQTGISAVNNNLGGIVINLNSGSTLDVSGGIATVGEYIRDTGAAGGITVTNQAGSVIDPDTGVDSQITNNANSGNVTVHQDGNITGNIDGVIAASNGTGNILVDGAGNIAGGNGVASVSLGSSPVSASNAGILAAQIGTSGGVTVSGTGTTSGTLAIGAFITDSSNTSAVLVDRSGAIHVTGATGFGVDATTAGLGTVTVQNTGTIAGSGGGTVAAGITATGSGGNVLVENVSGITAGATDGYGIAASTIGNGTVTVDTTGAITAAGNGVSATTTGGGKVSVTGTGAIIADSDSSGAGTGIIATSVGGAIVVTPGSTVSGASGIDAETNSNGSVTVTTSAGNVTGNTGYGVKTAAQDGATIVTNNGTTIQGNTYGVESTSGNGKITITGSGAINGGSGPAISAIMSGATGTGAGFDGILISGTGNTGITGAGDGIDAEITTAGNHSNIDITRSGTVTAGANGILATTLGDGNVTVTNTGNVLGITGIGIDAESAGGIITVTPSGTVSDASGIYGATIASGTVTVTTAFGGAGNVTGTTGFGISTSAENGNTAITNNALLVQGATYGATAVSSGTGAISIIGNGDYTGGSAGGISAVISGTGPSSGNGFGPGGVDGIYISGSGKTTTTDGAAIYAHEAGGSASILVNRTGLVTVTDTVGGGDGIEAITLGSGNVTVTGVTGVSAGHGSSAIGIDAESGGGSILVTPAGTVAGGNGIKATTTAGSGTVTVTTIAGSAGNVTGLDGFGVDTSAQDGNTIVNNKAQQISGTTWADNSTSTGTGSLTIEGAGNYVGGTGGGIGAFLTGGNSTPGTGIDITGSGNTSATTGYGIEADISNSGNDTNIVIDRTGTVTVSDPTGKDGIYAHTSDSGNVLIHDVSNVQGGTGAGVHGIDAGSRGGNVTVDLSTPILNSATVTGGDGIHASTINGGSVTVTTFTGTAGNVTGSDGYGVDTYSVDGNTVVTNNATTISGTTWADRSVVGGLGTITITDSGVTGNGNYVGGTSGGIDAFDYGTGPGLGHGAGTDLNEAILISGKGNTSATSGTGIRAVIDNSLNANSIRIDRTGTVTDTGGNGIYADIASGSGDVTVTGMGAVIASNTTGTGITALAQTGKVVVTPASTVYGSAGIDAETGGAGTVTVTTVGNITGTIGDGIHAASFNGDIAVTTAAGTAVKGASLGAPPGTGDGIDARASGAGNVRVIANSTVSGDPGIIMTSATGYVWATANDTTTGILQGVYAEVTSPAATTAAYVLVDGTGNITGGTTGVYADNEGAGNTTVSGSGNTEGDGGDGIDAYTVAGNVLINRTGTVSGSVTGINAASTGGGNVTITGVGNTSGTTGDGIHAVASGGNGYVSVTPAGTVTGSNDGIYARAHGSGAVTVTTASGDGGDVTGTNGDGIHAHAHDGNIDITNNATTVMGGDNGAFAISTGVGAITIDGPGTYTGTADDGIAAIEIGAGPLAGHTGIHITGAGNTSTTSGVGIYADISTAANHSDIVIDRTGTVMVAAGGGDGVDAFTSGNGNVTVTGTGNVTAGTGSTIIGIHATSTGGNVQVTPAGTVIAGGTGISAATNGAGTVTVTTASNAGGNVTGTHSDGIDTLAVDGNTVVTNNAATVSGAVNGDYSESDGTGAITITGPGTYAGGTGDGIDAVMDGAGPAAGAGVSPADLLDAGIWITGTGNATSTTGIGINAYIDYATNVSDIVIDRSGTVTVQSGGGDGVKAVTIGGGDIDITHTGAVQAGTGATSSGISADANGGSIDIEPASTVSGGGAGIRATTNSTGTITIKTVGNITGTALSGIYAHTTGSGPISITTGAGTLVSSTSDDGINARSSSGSITILANSQVSGTTGINAFGFTGDTDGILITANDTVTGTTGRGIQAELLNFGGAASVTVKGSGNVTGATDGIFARAHGTGGVNIDGTGNTKGNNGDGIIARTWAGNILIDRSGTVTGTTNGIYAYANGGGGVTVTGTGNVLGDITGLGYDGIYAVSTGGNGNVSVTPAGTVEGDTGIYASATGTGTVTVTTASNAGGNVTGTHGDGIDAYALNGNIVVTNNAATVSGTATGTYDETDGLGAITIAGPGTYHGGTGDGIDARMYGAGPAEGSGVSASTNGGIWITGTGNATTDTGTGINALINSGSNASDIVIDRSGLVTVGTSGLDGIDAVTHGTSHSDIFITGTGAVTAGTSAGKTGIYADATGGGSVTVEPASTVYGGGMGIDAEAVASGAVTVMTVANITGDRDDGIHARTADGDIHVTTASGTKVWGDHLGTGSGDGIDARASGSGNVIVDSEGTVEGDPGEIMSSVTGNVDLTENGAVTGDVGRGVDAQVTGSGATSYVSVTGSGLVTGHTDGIYAKNAGHGNATVSGSGNTVGNGGDGIDAYATNGAVLVSRTGTVTATNTGIDAETSAGGSVTVTGTGAVLANTGAGGYTGIKAIQAGGNGAVSVTPNSTVSGAKGIDAELAGTGAITVTTASGNGGNVTGTVTDGIDAISADGTITVTNNATTVSGHITGLYAISDALSTGGGAISVLGSGTFAGTTGDGIEAEMLGLGPIFGSNGISISGSVKASTTAGVGIYTLIDSASNASTISITTTGTVMVAAGGGDGIDAITIGGGNISITGTGNVTAGTGATGIYASTTNVNGGVTITPSGTVSGATGINANAVGTGAVTVTVTYNVTAGTSNGIVTSAVGGATHVNVNGGTTTGVGSGHAGVNELANGVGGLFVTVASGATVTGGTTAGGIKLSQTGTGSNTIANTGTITGAGTGTNPVISIATTASGSTSITNNSGGLIQSTTANSNNRPADLAIYSAVTTGNDSISNAGTLIGQIKLSNATNSLTNTGTWSARDNAGAGFTAASFGTGGHNTLTNSGAGVINAGNALAVATSTFTGIQTINNSATINAGLYGPGDITTFDAGANVQTVTNTGTMNVHGTLNFFGDATFANAGGIIDMRTSGAATTDVTGLNVTATNNTYSPGVAYDFSGGTNSRLGLDTYVGAASSAGSVVPSDRLLIAGAATSTTGILINDTDSGFGSYNPVGITLVGVNGASSDAFYLSSLTSASPYDLLETGYGPMGAIKKGFWVYPLLQSTHGEATADGLIGTNSTEYRLYGLPDVEAFQLPLAITGAQNIWYQTAQGWDDRQDEVRRYWDVYNSGRPNRFKPDIWLKATGSWMHRDVSHDMSVYAPAASVLGSVSTSFDQNVSSIQIGTDAQLAGTRDGVLVIGGSVGYVTSDLKFKTAPNRFDYSGGIIDATADYFNGPWFVDVLAKIDVLHLDLKFDSLKPFGYTTKNIAADTYGALSSGGYHFILNQSGSGQSYLEPMLSSRLHAEQHGRFHLARHNGEIRLRRNLPRCAWRKTWHADGRK